MNRYKIVNYLDKGSFGFVFTVQDMNADIKDDHDLVLKVGDNLENFEKEIITLMKLDLVQKRHQEQSKEEQKSKKP